MKRRIQTGKWDRVALEPRGLFKDRAHIFEQDDLDALEAALLARRPLLLRGEPGTGKSQIAEAAAAALVRPFVSFVVDGRTEPRDLRYRIDYVHRLGEAQIQESLPEEDRGDVRGNLALGRFACPGPLWWALDWSGAAALGLAEQRVPPPGWTPEQGVVLLIDEIDKAEADVPNGLLEPLGQGCFRGPDGQTISATSGEPLIVITTNEERELPDAFMRRCLVHTLTLSRDPTAFRDHLVRRGAAHFASAPPAPGDLSRDILEKAADLLFADRRAAIQAGEGRPGLAEYLDLLRVLHASGRDEAGQRDLLEVVRPFVFGKFAQRLAPKEEDAGGAR